MRNINEVLTANLNNSIASVVQYVPRFISGLIVLVIGLIIAAIVKQVLLQLFKIVGLEQLLKRYGVSETKGQEGVSWTGFIAELARWFVIILFLIPTVDIWGLSRFTIILNNLLSFLPNVIVAVLLLLVGFVASKFVHDLLLASLQGVSKESARSVAVVGRYAVLIFAILIVLNQLGIASDLIRILFAGFVAMVALAGGLAFGLGGREVAKEILTKLSKRL